MPDPAEPLNPAELSAEVLAQFGKARLADYLRKMGDNQATLDLTNAADRASRNLGQRIEEWNFSRMRGQAGETAGAEGGTVPNSPDALDGIGEAKPMNISIDSPVTITNNYPAPPPTEPAPAPASSAVQPAVPIAPTMVPPAAVAEAPKTSPWTKAALATAVAGLLAGGTALGVSLLRPAAGKDTDTDTTLTITIPEEDLSK